MAAVNPYLHFNGNCGEVFDFYKSVFGTEYMGGKMKYSDGPKEHQLPGGENDRIMHVCLPIGQGTYLMGSDRPSSFGDVTQGDSYYVSVSAGSEEEARRLFDGLSANGRIHMPLEKTFWGAFFGMFTDKYGINWMVNYQFEEPPKQ